MRKKLYFILSTFVTVILCAVIANANVFAAATTMPSAGTSNLTVVDISQWNDSINSSTDDINFPLLKTQVDAVYIRAFGNNSGVPYVDLQANNFAKASQKVNLLYGFYYYYVPKADPAAAAKEADAYYSFVKNYAYSCVPVLDVEENPNNLTNPQLAASVKAFTDEFKALSGFNLMIYSYPYFIKTNFDTSFNWSAYNLWIAHFNVSAPMEGISSIWMPKSSWCWDRWDMWQYTCTGTLSSIPGSSGGQLDMSHATDNILLSTPASLAALDSPSATQVNGGDIAISGWALSHSGVARIDIYADDFKWIGSTSNLYERPDVQQTMNGNGRYNDGLHSGFAYLADASSFTVGQHTLKIAVINRNESVDWILYTFNVGPISQICLDSPVGQVNTGDVTLSGWALSHAGIARIDIYMDNNQWIGSTANFAPRYDVNSALNSAGLYKNGLNSGFSYTIDAARLTPGVHTARVAAISNDGSAQWVTSTFTVGPASQMFIDSPASDINYGDINVVGWALSHAGISRVDIYMDNNQWIGTTSNMYERSDVNSALNPHGEYKDGLHCGFSYTIGAGSLTEGTHTIHIAAISKDGTVQWSQRTFTVGLKAQIYLDSPTSGVNSGAISVSGWAVSLSGVSRIDVYVDDLQWLGSTSNLYERSDVNSTINFHGKYLDALHSGFSYTINAGRIAAGTHTLKIAAISQDGSVQWIARTITIK